MQNTVPRTKKSKNNNRRFSDEQIKSLESVFETETKLEPRKKMKIARELGLQPRQVAIWFQNKRARWKSKQIEQEYRVLKANYDDLNSQFESLKMEKRSLLVQLQKLNELLKHHHGGGNNAAGCSNNGDETCEFEAKRDCSIEGLAMYSDDDERENTCCPAQEKEQEIFNMSKEEDGGSIVPVKKWSGLESSDVFYQSCETSNWWEFWT